MICNLTHITPIAQMEAIRMFLENTAHKGFTGYQMDVKIAFLHGSLKEDMLKQALRAWYDELSTFLLQNKFFKGIIDLTLFTRRFDYDILVDNQSPSGIFINQSNYVNEILKKYGLNTCDTIGTPMDIKDKLDLDQIGTPVDVTKYRSMIGALMYLTSSRPDILHATCDFGFELNGFSDANYARCKHTFNSTSAGAQLLGEKLSKIKILDYKHAEGTAKKSQDNKVLRLDVKMSAMIHQALDRLCLNVEVDEHSLGDLNEPNNYKAAILDLESDKWVDAINEKIQTMKYNQVWCLVDLPPNCKTNVRKWIFKKKTNMDGLVHTYKARLVAKGYTQTNRFDYKETFSPVADIRDIRILIAIEAFYNYEIWMDTSKRGYIPMQERNDLNKTHSASTPKEVKCMQNVPYALAVG
uniref:Reverse transcriptase Ty1/copia-type domain-containing protein n=1 Tax=Tanacetum cinerariifolium TaxID=118510 RepID=A0A699GSF4_TANCI|nr:hypothetical protein [Tanacetum cinerariifolium]